MKKIICLLIIISFMSLNVVSQELNEPAWVYKARGDKYYNLKDYSKAIEEYLKAINKNKEYPEVYYKLGLIYKSRDLLDLSEYYFNQALLYKKHLEIDMMEVLILYELADLNFYKGNFYKFLENNLHVIKKDYNYEYFNKSVFSLTNIIPQGESVYARAYFSAGYYYFFTGNYNVALKYLFYAKLYNYNLSATYFLLANIYKIFGDTIKANQYFDLSYSFNKKYKLLIDKYNPFKKMPFSNNYLIELEKLIYEYDGYIYLRNEEKK